MDREEGARDELGEEVGRLLAAFYAAGDTHAADLPAKKIVAAMEPLLRKWVMQADAAPADAMRDREDLCLEAQEKLWDALHKSRRAAPILDLFAYARVVVLRLLLMQIRSGGRQKSLGKVDMDGIAVQHCQIEEMLAREEARQVFKATWQALAQCRLSGRRALLLAHTRDDIHLWVGLPDACPRFARILEMEEGAARRLWIRLPLEDKEIAQQLDTSVSYVQKLRSLTRTKMWQLVFAAQTRENNG